MASLGTAFGAPVNHAGYRTEAGDFVAPQVRLADAGVDADRASESAAVAPEPAKPVSPYLPAKEAAKYLRRSWSWFRKNATKIPRHDSGTYHKRDLDEFKRTAKPDKRRSRKKTK